MMIPYYQFDRKMRTFDPATAPLRPGDIVCHRERLRRVTSARPLRLAYSTGGAFAVASRGEAVLLPEYSRPHPERLSAPAPAEPREPELDMNELCDHVGLAIGRLLQRAAHGTPVPLREFYDDAEGEILLRELLRIEHPFELRHWKRVLAECAAGAAAPRRAGCYRALLLGRCLHLARGDRPRAFGLAARLLRGGGDRSDEVKYVFDTMLHLAAPPPHLRVRGESLWVREPEVCALHLERLLHRLREGDESATRAMPGLSVR